MRTAEAKRFIEAPSPKQLSELWSKEPQTAASFFVEYSHAAGLKGPFVQQLEKLLSTSFESDGARDQALKSLLAQSPNALEAFATATAQVARVSTLGFQVDSPTSATLSGTVRVENDKLYLETESGRFEVDSPAWEDKVQFRHLEANLMRSFEGKTVTVRAWPAETAGKIAVEEFAPGGSAQFLSGRLTTVDGQPAVRVRPDKVVFLRNPAFAEKLRAYADLEQGHVYTRGRMGVILPGNAVEENGKFFYDADPKDFWMLAKALNGVLQVSHGQEHPFTGNVDAAQRFADQRLMVFGHVDDAGTIVAKGAVAAPAVRYEVGTAFRRDALELVKAAPLTPAERPVDGDFGL